MLFRNGDNAKQVHHWLGHHSPSFSLSTYVHLVPDDVPAATFWGVPTRRERQVTAFEAQIG